MRLMVVDGEDTMKSFKLLILALLLASSAIVGETFGAAAPNMSQSVAGGGVTAKVVNGSKPVELVLKDIAGVKERIFRWDLD